MKRPKEGGRTNVRLHFSCYQANLCPIRNCLIEFWGLFCFQHKRSCFLQSGVYLDLPTFLIVRKTIAALSGWASVYTGVNDSGKWFFFTNSSLGVSWTKRQILTLFPADFLFFFLNFKHSMLGKSLKGFLKPGNDEMNCTATEARCRLVLTFLDTTSRTNFSLQKWF